MRRANDRRGADGGRRANGRRTTGRLGDRVRAFRFVALLGLAATALGGCFPSSATEQGTQIHNLYQLFFAGGIVVAVIVWGLTTWAIFRYRRRDDRLPVQTADNRLVEVTWTVIPLLTVLVLFGFTYATLTSVDATSPEPGVQVVVTAFRWQWTFDYPEQNITMTGVLGQDPEMVVPVGEPIHVTLISSDVDHAFYVPAFLFKKDAIPGHPNTFDFTVDQAGTYRGQCADFCGVFHAQMTFSVRAVAPAEFEQWATSQAAGASQAPGSSQAPATSPGAAATQASATSLPPGASPTPAASSATGVSQAGGS